MSIKINFRKENVYVILDFHWEEWPFLVSGIYILTNSKLSHFTVKFYCLISTNNETEKTSKQTKPQLITIPIL